MLKKVMIICLAFSFVFIGGIAFALGDRPEAIKEGQEISPESAQSSGDIVSPDVPEELITDESKTMIEEGVELKDESVELKDKVIELKDKVIEEGGNVQKN
ncbi:MAG: hypothetical protein K8R28_07325 [Desulfobacterales bacterium]|nr:hypothetical protein [Desulfobacterales bacterium]